MTQRSSAREITPVSSPRVFLSAPQSIRKQCSVYPSVRSLDATPAVRIRVAVNAMRQRVGRAQITGQLGEGGMGVVYRGSRRAIEPRHRTEDDPFARGG